MSGTKFQSIVVIIICFALVRATDVSSFSNVDIIEQKKIEINFRLDFDKKIIDGKMKIYFEPKEKGELIILDTKNLDIKSIIDSNTGEEVQFELDYEHALKHLGVPLKIYYVYEPITKDETYALVITYSTTDKSDSVQWLDPAMTSGKNQPFMFTQCESIACRTLLPCQDTPSAKFLLSSSITVKKPLYALNAGIYQGKKETETHTTFFYDLKIPIPSYLIALAAGAIVSKKISERSSVYGEIEMVALAASEFSETEQFIQIAEAYTIPYQWGECNILILPPSFPYGGMENPTLIFANPSLLAGDKSLANLIAHEIAHSWSGNLVTNANWSNFWLNEGFTVFIERKILEKKFGEDGKEFKKLSSLIGVSEWNIDVQNLGLAHAFTSLNPPLLGKNPDDATTAVPYERGYNLLYYLETLVNSADKDKDLFQIIMKNYFEKFKFQSIEWEQFKNFFEQQINSYLPLDAANGIIQAMDWDDWINSRGFPKAKNDFANKYDKEIKARTDDFFNNKLDNTFVNVFKNWHTNLKLYFLFCIMDNEDGLSLTDPQYKLLVETLNLKEGYNSEITFKFFMLALANKKLDIKDQLHAYLAEYGRMKYIRPLYKSYALINKADALSLFNSLKNTYHPIAVKMIESDFKKL